MDPNIFKDNVLFITFLLNMLKRYSKSSNSDKFIYIDGEFDCTLK